MDKISTTIFGVQIRENFSQFVFQEENIFSILHLISGLKDAIFKSFKIQKIFEIYVLLIPEWNEGQNYLSEMYKTAKQKFLNKVQLLLGQYANIIDFWSQSYLDNDVKDYMQNLGKLGSGGFGSCADIIKFYTIINNQEINHLNLDGNTKIINFQKFINYIYYENNQQYLLNACYYDQDYITAHNKIIYTKKNSDFVKKLQRNLIKYCKLNKLNQQDKRKNSIFSKVFTSVTLELNITQKIVVNQTRTIYAANLDNKCFGLTKHIACAINSSWNQIDNFLLKQKYNTQQKLNNIYININKKIKIQDVYIDIKCIQYIIKKYYGQIKYKYQQKLINQLLILKDNDINLLQESQKNIGIFQKIYNSKIIGEQCNVRYKFLKITNIQFDSKVINYIFQQIGISQIKKQLQILNKKYFELQQLQNLKDIFIQQQDQNNRNNKIKQVFCYSSEHKEQIKNF